MRFPILRPDMHPVDRRACIQIRHQHLWWPQGKVQENDAL